MAVEFYSWNGHRAMVYRGRVEDGEVVDDVTGTLEALLTDDDLLAEREGIDDVLSAEDYLVRRFAGPKFVAVEKPDGGGD